MKGDLQISYNTLLSENRLGATITTQRSKIWKHPWFTDAIWLPKEKTWGAVVLAGFVNGQAPMVKTTAGALREAKGTFYGQIIDARSGSAESRQAAQLAMDNGVIDASIPDKTEVDIPLYQNPPVKLLRWRNIGEEGGGQVPVFFQKLGVRPTPAPITASSTAAQVVASVSTQPTGNRLLRACDVMLHQPRVALTSQITFSAIGLITGATNVTQTLGYQKPSAIDRLSIQTGIYNEARDASLDFQGASNALGSNYEEKTWDELLISTIYLLSPANAPADAVPDASWKAFTKHYLFWNLLWKQPKIQPFFNTNIFAGIVGLVSVLGGGAGIGAVNWVAASINDATQGAANILQSQSLAGSFWTPTGGGAESTLPSVHEKAKITLDKAANNLSKALARAKLNNYKLDPVFPFSGIGFNLAIVKK